jgi:hypothetical protein
LIGVTWRRWRFGCADVELKYSYGSGSAFSVLTKIFCFDEDIFSILNGDFMLQRLIDDFRENTRTTLRLTSLAMATAILLFITIAFLCAAAYIYVYQRYGALEASLAGAGVFCVAALITAALYDANKRRTRRQPAEAAKSATQSALSDPMVLAVGLQLARTIGIKRMLPLLISGIILGAMAKKRTPHPSMDKESAP